MLAKDSNTRIHGFLKNAQVFRQVLGLSNKFRSEVVRRRRTLTGVSADPREQSVHLTSINSADTPGSAQL